MLDHKAIKELIEAHVPAQKWATQKPAGLYAPMDYLLSMRAKRIRPVLLMLSYQAVSGQSPENALNAGFAVESFHNFTLMHDDIMDNAPVRRGEPTVHVKWDEDTAILAGDAMFALSYGMLVQNFPSKAAELVTEFTKVAVGVCEGQMRDMEMADSETATIEDYIQMIRQKTAMLIAGSLKLGAIAGGADAETAERFYGLGEAAGIGFQLQDDYLDAFAEQAKFGKQVGGDILEGKRTFLLLKAFELANESQTRELNRLLNDENNPETKVAGVKKLFVELGIPQLTQALIEQYFEEAARLSKELSALEGFAYIREYLKAIFQREF